MNMLLIAPVLLLQLSAPGDTQAVPPTAPELGDNMDQGLSRETMWRAPTPKDWERQVLIPFQRTWTDARAVSEETGKPILACINMDGEIASEHYAGVRYRQAEVATLFEPFVCVIASVYRHNPRDFESSGKRVLCPRFGSVTCGEHIALEPILFQLYLDNDRVAPRHIIVEQDGTESQDVYYANDTASVFRVVRKSASGRSLRPSLIRADRPLLERLESFHLADRSAVEMAFATGSIAERRVLLNAALESSPSRQVQLWRLALYSGSPELARLGVKGLAAATSPEAIDLILTSLSGLDRATDREVLVAALDRIAVNSDRARQLTRSFIGLSMESTLFDSKLVAGVLKQNGGGQVDAAIDRLLELEYAAKDGGLASDGVSSPVSSLLRAAEQALERANAEFEIARSSSTDRRYVELYIEDATRSLTASRGLLGSSLAWKWELLELALDLTKGGHDAYKVSTESRVKQLVPKLPSEAHLLGGLALRDVLAAFVRSREADIRVAIHAKSEWPGEWMADICEAFLAIENAPGTLASEFVAHYDFLRYMGAFNRAARVLETAVARFQSDPFVHERLRNQILRDNPFDAIDGLEGRYEAMLAAPDAPDVLDWYAGYASRMTAEILRRHGQLRSANEAYSRATAHFRKAARSNSAIDDSVATQMAICLAGQARIHMDLDESGLAAKLLLESFETAPLAAATLDGLNVSALLTASQVQRVLNDHLLAALLGEALQELRRLDPHLFNPPDFERNSLGRAAVGFRSK